MKLKTALTKNHARHKTFPGTKLTQTLIIMCAILPHMQAHTAALYPTSAAWVKERNGGYRLEVTVRHGNQQDENQQCQIATSSGGNDADEFMRMFDNTYSQIYAIVAENAVGGTIARKHGTATLTAMGPSPNISSLYIETLCTRAITT